MKKSSLLFMISIIISLPIFSMEIEKEQGRYHIPQNLCSPTEQGFFVVAIQEIQYSPNEYKKCTSHIPYTISLINKNLYKVFKDPIIARNIITDIKNTYDFNKFDFKYVKKFQFPGAKKCFELSKQLYDKNMIPDKVEELFNQGAFLDYNTTSYRGPRNMPDRDLLGYWCFIPSNNEDQAISIIKKLLDLGVNPNENNLLEFVISIANNPDIPEIILNHKSKYKPMITPKVWQAALTRRATKTYIDLLIRHATQDELNNGLICCVTPDWDSCKGFPYIPQIMHRFVVNGANPNSALPNALEWIKYTFAMPGWHDIAKNNFTFLYEHKAFNPTTVTELQETIDFFTFYKNKIEQNRSSNMLSLEQ